MKYYIILLLYGRVVEICKYDDSYTRDYYFKTFRDRMPYTSEYDDVQQLDEWG